VLYLYFVPFIGFQIKYDDDDDDDGKYSERVQLPAKAKFGVFLSPTLGNTCHTYY